MKLEEVKKYAEEKLKIFKKKSENRLHINIDYIELDWSLPLGKALGMASYKSKTIKLNKNLAKEFGKKYIDEVIPHEVAHFIVFEMYPKGYKRVGKSYKKIQAHGKEFKSVCRLLGFNGKATTSLFSESAALKAVIAPKRKEKRHEIKCQCRSYIVTTRYNNKIFNKGYICSVCKQEYVYVAERNYNIP